MDPQNGSQERWYPERIEWNGELRYKPYHHSDDRPYIPAMIENLGTQGLCFITSTPIPVDSILCLKLFHYHDYSPIKILAKVKYCDFVPEHEGYAVDCLYHDLSEEDQSLVNEVVEEICFIRRIRLTMTETLNHQKSWQNGNQKIRYKRARRKAKKINRPA